MKRPSVPLADALAELQGLGRKALAERWAMAFGCPAPCRSHAPFLRAALAWHFQMQQISKGDKAKTDRLLRGLRRGAGTPAAGLRPAAGTRLLREWQGHTHHVTVQAQGFEYQGKTYRSLTAIAREITGTAWSGPLFFGLRS